MNLKSSEEIEIMTEGGRKLAQIMQETQEHVAIDIPLSKLDAFVHTAMKEAGGVPSFLGYRPVGARNPFPASICASVNTTVVHGVPGEYAVREGDVLKLDFGFLYKGFHTDAAFTVAIGTIAPETERLIAATKRALQAGIEQMYPGNTLGDIGHAIETIITTEKFFIIRMLTGHGIGKQLHEDPYVQNWGTPGSGIKLTEGMVFAIEPMTAIGTGNVIERPDGSFVTADGSMSAHFEHTIAITNDGPRILTVKE